MAKMDRTVTTRALSQEMGLFARKVSLRTIRGRIQLNQLQLDSMSEAGVSVENAYCPRTLDIFILGREGKSPERP